MANFPKGDSKDLPITSVDEIRRMVGPVGDHTALEILGLRPTGTDVEVAMAYALGEGHIADIEGHPLAGLPARVYEILLADELYQDDET